MTGRKSQQAVTEAMVDAAATVIWNDRDARHGGPWSARAKNEIAVLQTMATARAALEAALAQAQAKPVEVPDDARDAERWRALLRCARINVWGSAGFDPKTGKRQQYSNATGEYEDRSDGWVHFGAEFWSIWPGAEDPDPETRWGTVALKALADDVLLKERETAAPEPKP